MKFNNKKLFTRNQININCSELKQCIDLLDYLTSKGYKWKHGLSTRFSVYHEKTIYTICNKTKNIYLDSTDYVEYKTFSDIIAKNKRKIKQFYDTIDVKTVETNKKIDICDHIEIDGIKITYNKLLQKYRSQGLYEIAGKLIEVANKDVKLTLSQNKKDPN